MGQAALTLQYPWCQGLMSSASCEAKGPMRMGYYLLGTLVDLRLAYPEITALPVHEIIPHISIKSATTLGEHLSPVVLVL